MRISTSSALPAVLLATLVACSRTPAEPTRDAGRPDGAAFRRLEVGDRVVVESAIATFVEGTVSAVERDQAHIEIAQGRVLDQPSSEVYALARAGASPVPSAGSFAVCHLAEGRWRGCRVSGAVADDRVRVVDDELTPTEIGKADVLPATPVSELNIRQRFDKNARRRAFRDGAKTAVQPRVPSGWHRVSTRRCSPAAINAG